MPFLDDPLNFLLMSTGRLPALIFALSFHEAAHAWMALRCGDDTAARMGRITLNPLAHLDPIGTIGIIFFFFGWGKPVPFVERNLRNPRRDAMLIAAAGPASNILLAVLFGIAFRITFYLHFNVGFESEAVMRIIAFLNFLFAWCVFLNLILCFFNLIPIFPLDGEKILVGLLPARQAYTYASFRQYGPMGLLLLIFLGGPIISAFVFSLGSPICYLLTGFGMEGIFGVIFHFFQTLW